MKEKHEFKPETRWEKYPSRKRAKRPTKKKKWELESREKPDVLLNEGSPRITSWTKRNVSVSVSAGFSVFRVFSEFKKPSRSEGWREVQTYGKSGDSDKIHGKGSHFI